VHEFADEALRQFNHADTDSNQFLSSKEIANGAQAADFPQSTRNAFSYLQSSQPQAWFGHKDLERLQTLTDLTADARSRYVNQEALDSMRYCSPAAAGGAIALGGLGYVWKGLRGGAAGLAFTAGIIGLTYLHSRWGAGKEFDSMRQAIGENAGLDSLR
jgi:hypothetical protein